MLVLLCHKLLAGSLPSLMPSPCRRLRPQRGENRRRGFLLALLFRARCAPLSAASSIDRLAPGLPSAAAFVAANGGLLTPSSASGLWGVAAARSNAPELRSLRGGAPGIRHQRWMKARSRLHPRRGQHAELGSRRWRPCSPGACTWYARGRCWETLPPSIRCATQGRHCPAVGRGKVEPEEGTGGFPPRGVQGRQPRKRRWRSRTHSAYSSWRKQFPAALGCGRSPR